MIKSLIQRLVRKIRGPNVVLEDTRASVTHRYIFSEPTRDCRAMCTSYGSGKARIDYFIPRHEGTPAHIHLFLVEDTLHELAHWATEETAESDHTDKWRKTLYPVIDYTTDAFDINYE